MREQGCAHVMHRLARVVRAKSAAGREISSGTPSTPPHVGLRLRADRNEGKALNACRNPASQPGDRLRSGGGGPAGKAVLSTYGALRRLERFKSSPA